MTPRQVARLRTILSLSELHKYPTRDYASHDIPTRAEIDRLVLAIALVFEPTKKVTP